MTWYRLVIEEIRDSEVITTYTRWVDAVQVRGLENQEVYLTFSPHFEHIWLETGPKRCLTLIQKGNVQTEAEHEGQEIRSR
jgi:hypothetical protein